ncbi:UPF0361 protein C3orf37 [Dunaliella salina]|uniref:UPF0361 protein C3orf37 n=1 Tax=Dunaliella salina TaxID=3046 RepID=A0ABQ7HA90_DUNSA|nr:UPF0361 protein C3orf37 [Dunaliella salina]|eukprot:KAF5843765.1 UPF0361 protein C3orf37 [Dunaliella salina]
MCGRSRQSLRPQAYAAITGIPENRWRNREMFEPRYNCGPGMWLPVIRCSSEDGAPEIQTMKWGLIPSFHKQEEKMDFFKMFNARSETITTSPVFRRLLPSKRCIVLINGFYEWKKSGNQKQPYYIHRGPIMACAGLYDICTGPDGAPLYTFTICTTDSSSRLQWLHDRMPVILSDRAAMEDWLGAPLPSSCIFQEDGTVDISAFEACTKQGTHSQTSPSKVTTITSSPAPGSTKEDPSEKGQEDVNTPGVKAETDGVKAEAGGEDGEGPKDGGPGSSSQGTGSQQQKEAGPSPAPTNGQDVQALVAKACKPYAGSDLEWHPVTPDVGKTTTEGPRCCQDIRASKGTISSFFKPKQQQQQQQPASKQADGLAVKRERQDEKDGGDAKRSKP